MKRIPFWESRAKSVNVCQQGSIAHTSPLPFIMPSSPVYHNNSAVIQQLDPVYIGQNIQVYSYHPATHCHSTNDKVSMQMEKQMQIEETEMSVVHDKLSNKIIRVPYAIFMCSYANNLYWFVVAGQGSRYQVVSSREANICHTLTQHSLKEAKHCQHSNDNRKVDTDLKPMIKYDSVFAVTGRGIYVGGSEPLHQWEIASPLWIYLFNSAAWQQIEYNPNIANNSKIQYSNIMSEQYLTCQEGAQKKQLKQWTVPLEPTVIIIGSKGMHAKVLNPAKNTIQSSSVEIMVNGEHKVLQQNMIRPDCDSFVYSYYINKQGYCSVLVLCKPNTPARVPILLQLSLAEYLKPSNISNCGFYIRARRFDLGLFLWPNSVTGLPSKLWDVVNQVTYINLTQSIIPHNFSKTDSMQSQTIDSNHHSSHINTNIINKIKGNESSKCKDNMTLHLYCRNTKNSHTNHSWSYNASNLKLTVHSIRISLLQEINLNASNISLTKYYQLKQYSDMVIKAETHEILCNKQLFEFHSPKFKRLFASTTANINGKADGVTTVKLQHTKFTTAYFLVQQLYHQFAISLKTIDQTTLFDIMVLAHKFQITPLQILCEQQIKFDVENFPKLYSYFRNSETPKFRQQLLKCFIMNPHVVIKNMPIGKVEELIRHIYSPECSHSNLTEIKAKLQNTYSLKDPQTGQTKDVSKCINYAGIIKGQEIVLKICNKCCRLLGFNHESHRKNKSSVRGNSVGSFGHRKKDNNSN